MMKSESVFNPAALPADYMKKFEEDCATAEPGKTHFLYPGQVFVSRDGKKISTILGSCAAVCLWDKNMRIGGMNHYLLPQGPENSPNPHRYGSNANLALLKQLLSLGCQTRNMQAKIFGGASAFAADPTQSLGSENIRLAEQFVHELGIPLLLKDANGKRGRRLTFHTDDGTTLLKIFE